MRKQKKYRFLLSLLQYLQVLQIINPLKCSLINSDNISILCIYMYTEILLRIVITGNYSKIHVSYYISQGNINQTHNFIWFGLSYISNLLVVPICFIGHGLKIIIVDIKFEIIIRRCYELREESESIFDQSKSASAGII